MVRMKRYAGKAMKKVAIIYRGIGGDPFELIGPSYSPRIMTHAIVKNPYAVSICLTAFLVSPELSTNSLFFSVMGLISLSEFNKLFGLMNKHH